MSRRPARIPTRIDTPRLVLRPPMESDARELNRHIRASFDWLHPWIPWAAKRPTLAQTRKYCRDGARRYPLGEDMPLLMLHRESGEILGGSGLHRIDWNVPAVEIGYWLRHAHAGHGYVTEATKAVAAFAFDVLGVRRIEIRCDTENLPSRRVAERAGFPLESIRRRDHRTRLTHALGDTCVFALTCEDRGGPRNVTLAISAKPRPVPGRAGVPARR